MRKLPVTLILLLGFLAYAAGLGSGPAFEELRDALSRADRSVGVVVGAALVGFVAGGRRDGEEGTILTLDRVLLTVLAVLLLHQAWIGGRAEAPPGPAQGLEIEDGDGQEAAAGSFLPDSLRVRATGENGRAVAGESVGFRLRRGAGRLIFAERETRPDGTCENWLRLGDGPGDRIVEAFLVARLEVVVSFLARTVS